MKPCRAVSYTHLDVYKRQALSGAGLTVADINEILLVGGATRTPLVQRRLEEDLGIQPRAEVDPDLCVAMGAAATPSRLSLIHI